MHCAHLVGQTKFRRVFCLPKERVAQSLAVQRLCGFPFKCAFVHPPATAYDQRPECDSRRPPRSDTQSNRAHSTRASPESLLVRGSPSRAKEKVSRRELSRFCRPLRGWGEVGGQFSHGSRRGLPSFARYAGWGDGPPDSLRRTLHLVVISFAPCGAGARWGDRLSHGLRPRTAGQRRPWATVFRPSADGLAGPAFRFLTTNVTFGRDFFRPLRGWGGVGGPVFPRLTPAHGGSKETVGYGLSPATRASMTPPIFPPVYQPFPRGIAGRRDIAHLPAASPGDSARDSTIPATCSIAIKGKTTLPARPHSPRSGRKIVAHCASGG